MTHFQPKNCQNFSRKVWSVSAAEEFCVTRGVCLTLSQFLLMGPAIVNKKDISQQESLWVLSRLAHNFELESVHAQENGDLLIDIRKWTVIAIWQLSAKFFKEVRVSFLEIHFIDGLNTANSNKFCEVSIRSNPQVDDGHAKKTLLLNTGEFQMLFFESAETLLRQKWNYE